MQDCLRDAQKQVVSGLLVTVTLLSDKTSLRLQWLKANTIWLFSLHCNPATLMKACYFLSRCGYNNYICKVELKVISNPSFINAMLTVNCTEFPFWFSQVPLKTTFA